MLKVQIQTTCNHCKGQAYLPVGEAEDYKGEKHTRYLPCPSCQGSGNEAKWISLEEFSTLLRQSACPHKHTSFRGCFHYNGSDLWDNITEFCDDCGSHLYER